MEAPARGRGGAGPARGWARSPAVLLAALALAQLVLVHQVGLSPWKGGGFGMFSTLDNSNFRSVRVFADEDGRQVPVELPPETDRLRRAIRVLPLHRWLARLADRAFAVSPGARAIRIEVWRMAFDPHGLRPSEHLLTRATFRAGS